VEPQAVFCAAMIRLSFVVSTVPLIYCSTALFAAAETERGRFDSATIRNLLSALYLRLIASDFKELGRLVDVLKLHGFLPSFDCR
jgi:hypothetical protein